MRLLVALSRRPRGAALLARAPLAQQAGWALLSMSRYDDEAVSRALGWDADAVVARGRELRGAEATGSARVAVSGRKPRRAGRRRP
jgi:hypothetical protein